MENSGESRKGKKRGEGRREREREKRGKEEKKKGRRKDWKKRKKKNENLIVRRFVVVRRVERGMRMICIMLVVAFSVLLERKILRLSQNRGGPMVNRWWGVIQTILDGVKLLRKEKKKKSRKNEKE